MSFSSLKILEKEGHLRKKDHHKQKSSGAKMPVGTVEFSRGRGHRDSPGREEAVTVTVWTGEDCEGLCAW